MVIASSAVAQGNPERCGVELLVTLANGHPIGSATAQLLNAEGTIVQSTSITAGRGRFCDFGFGPHSIRVVRAGSLATTLSGIEFIFGQTQQLYVTMNPASSKDTEEGGGNACRAYIRAQTLDGKPIAGAIASIRNTRVRGDDYGRFMLLVPLNAFTEFRFEKAGFAPRSLVLSCSSWDELLERAIILTPSPQ
jgi:hypothetical protein